MYVDIHIYVHMYMCVHIICEYSYVCTYMYIPKIIRKFTYMHMHTNALGRLAKNNLLILSFAIYM